MRDRLTERSSILLLSRTTVVIGIIAITVVSFGLGYFFGYKGGDGSAAEQQAVENEKGNESVPFGEKRVLEAPPVKEPPAASAPERVLSFPAPAKAPESSSPGIVEDTSKSHLPKESVATASPLPQKQQNAVEGLDKSSEGKGLERQSSQVQKKVNGKDAVRSVKKAGAQRKTAKAVKGTTKKKASKAGGAQKRYAIQLGAFPSREGAEELRRILKVKGYKPYIVDAGKGTTYFKVRVGEYAGKEEAGRAAAALHKKTGIESFVTAVD